MALAMLAPSLLIAQQPRTVGQTVPAISPSLSGSTRWNSLSGSSISSKPTHGPALLPVKYQREDGGYEERAQDYQIQLEPPGLERISRLDSDAKLQERIRQEAKLRDPSEIILFPDEPILSRDSYQGRGSIWPRRSMIVEPNYVCYGRLLFQDLNAERYGWDLGPIHPVVATGKFFYDLALWPMHLGVDPFGNDCSTGYCLPGDPVPFMLYPPEVTVRGSIVELGVVLALVAIFP